MSTLFSALVAAIGNGTVPTPGVDRIAKAQIWHAPSKASRKKIREALVDHQKHYGNQLNSKVYVENTKHLNPE